MVECSTVSREVAGSNPVGTAKLRIEQLAVYSPWMREDVEPCVALVAVFKSCFSDENRRFKVFY
jgi:hypothetical protein